MPPLVKRKLFNYTLFVLGVYLLEGISFAYMGWGFFPVYFFLDFILLLILGAPIFFFKNTLFDRIYLSILIPALAFVFCLDANYYISTGIIFSLRDLDLALGGLKVLTGALSLIYIWPFITEGIIVSLLIFTLIFVNYRCKIKNDKAKKHRVIIVVSILSTLFALTVYPVSLYLASNFDRDVNQNITANQVNISKNLNFRNLGPLTYYIKEFECMFLSHHIYTVDKIKEFTRAGKATTNDFTGLLKDYNVITIMIETGARHMMNETLTPNLWKLAHNGIDCTHNYSKNKTSTVERIAIFGNFTVNGIDTSCHYDLPFALPNAIGNYHTSFFHDAPYERDLYNRHELTKNIGFDNCYLHEQLYPNTPAWDWHYYSFDSETTDRVIDFLDATPTDRPFYVSYTTLTMHGPYVQDEYNVKYYDTLREHYGDKLKNAENNRLWTNDLKGTDDESSLVNYMLKVMDFDEGLGRLMSYLERSGKKDKTLLVLYGDHDIYYPSVSGKHLSQLIYHIDDINNIKLYNTMLTFYCPALNDLYFEKYHQHEFVGFTSPDCVVPTILDLLGKRYSSNLYLSDSLFNSINDGSEIFYSFELCTFMNEHYCTQTVNQIEKVFDDNNTKQAFLVSIRKLINKLLYITAIYTDNVFVGQNYEDFLPK